MVYSLRSVSVKWFKEVAVGLKFAQNMDCPQSAWKAGCCATGAEVLEFNQIGQPPG